MDPQIKALQEAIAHTDTVVKVGFAFGRSDSTTYWGVTLLGPRRKKLSPFLVAHDPHPNTPAGALRSLADLLEVKD